LTKTGLKEQIEKFPEEFSIDELIENLILTEKIETGNRQSEKGEVISDAEIKNDFEKMIGTTVPKSTIYRLLKRHNRRKIVPLPFHPKQKKEEQESFKKTLSMK